MGGGIKKDNHGSFIQGSKITLGRKSHVAITGQEAGNGLMLFLNLAAAAPHLSSRISNLETE